MDIATIAGLVLGVVMFVFGVISNHAELGSYMDLPSVIITIGGSISSVLASSTITDFINGLKGFVLAVKGTKENPEAVIKNIIDLANIARKEGLLALEEAGDSIEDPFLKKGIGLVVDGTDPELVRGILETDLINIEARHKKVIAFWDKWAELGPAWGMIGTLIGLVNMLQNLEDASSIGPSMAVALLTTLYGSLIANWLCNPIATSLGTNNAVEQIIKEITLEGLLSIQAGENPRVIEEKLKSFLSPKVREALSSEGGGE